MITTPDPGDIPSMQYSTDTVSVLLLGIGSRNIIIIMQRGSDSISCAILLADELRKRAGQKATDEHAVSESSSKSLEGLKDLGVCEVCGYR